MKNDFDFIKDKINDSGVNAPDSMDESYVLDKLGDTQPKVVEFKPKRGYVRIAAAAASFVLVAALATVLTIHFTNRDPVTEPVGEDNSGLIRFSSYEEVRDAVDKINSRTGRGKYLEADMDYAAAESSKTGSSGSSGSSSGTAKSNSGSGGSGQTAYSKTYRQVEGVDEGDIIKTDGRYIYCIDNTYSYTNAEMVSIFAANPDKHDPLTRFVPGDSPAVSTSDETSLTAVEYNNVRDMYIKDNRLIVICSGTTYNNNVDYYSTKSITQAYVYDVSDISKISLMDAYTQSGYYISSRMIGDMIYVITNEYATKDIPLCGRGSTPDEIPADCIYSLPEPTENTYLIVSGYNTVDKTAATQSKAILGIAENIYCNENSLYIYATDWSAYRYYDYIDYEADGAEQETAQAEEPAIKTKIFKVSLKGGITFTAHTEVDGYINNQYSLDEYNGNLRVATTVSDYTSGGDKNNIYVLDSDLKRLGSVTGFAPDESIKAVRYIGDTAYVITYVQTDPLFVIDLSAPTNPKILGEVKISGFSTMLVPVDDNTILGLGINTGEYDYTDLEVQDGFKLALFDVSDKSNPKVLDSRSYVEYESPVMYDPHALVYNPERGDYVVPLNYYGYSTDGCYGGMLNFKVENGKIVENDKYSSPVSYSERCVYVGDTVYILGTDSNTGKQYMDSRKYR